jgi:NHL repeat
VADQENNGLTNPTAIAVGRTGNLYIADTGNNRLVGLPWKRTTNAYGTQTTVGTNLLGPKGSRSMQLGASISSTLEIIEC